MMGSPFRPCSGQARGARHWSVCYEVPGREWWRPETASGQVRKWASCEAAQRFAQRLNVLAVEDTLAREAAASLRAMSPAQKRQLRSYRGIAAAFWGRDPFGLYTSDIAPD